MTSELKSMFGENCPEQPVQPQQNIKKELEKKNKDYMKKQTGLKRELYKLIGRVDSILERTGNKMSKGASNWAWAKFTNPARTDNLRLVHWQKAEDVNKDYDFAKFNQNIDIVEFTKEEYDTLIKPNDRNWNYEQTCYLWDLIKRYELRFIVIMDRFDEEKYGERTVESLKDRYYSVARTILENRKMFDHPIIKSGYNFDQEMKRRTYLEKTMSKTFAELKEESNLFEMSENLNKKVEKNDNVSQKNFNELKAPNFSSLNQSKISNNNKIQIPMTADDGDNSINDSENKNINNNATNTSEIINSNINPANIINEDTIYEANGNNQTFEDYLKYNITTNDSFVYLRSQKMKHSLPVCEKIQERVNNYMSEYNFDQKLIPTAKVEIAYDNLRNNLILYTSLKKYLEKKDKEYTFLQNKFKECKNRKNPHMINKNITQFSKSNIKYSNQIELREQDNIPSINNDFNSSINSEKEEISNNSINNSDTNINPPENKQGGLTDKRRKINRLKIRKRKIMDEDAAPTNEEKDQSYKKKKKGIK